LFIKTSTDFADAADFQSSPSREGREGGEGKYFLRDLCGLRAEFFFRVNRRNLRMQSWRRRRRCWFWFTDFLTAKHTISVSLVFRPAAAEKFLAGSRYASS